MDERASIRVARDRLAMLAEICNNPSRALAMPTSKRLQKPESTKGNNIIDLNEFPFPVQSSAASLTSDGYCVAQTAPRRSRLHMASPAVQEQKESKIHTIYFRENAYTALQSSISTPDSDLWILPDMWELESESPPTSPQQEPCKKSAEWAPIVERAVRSNQERLKSRLEGDGWDFVNGRYGEDIAALKGGENEEKVDEEFDVVVLPLVQAV
ncbi:hypothetical protein DM02DRAFT_63570 [Periconia macrospinosa]|uniref:Uncharacterized protein n=1 Tax=Periconia macrospinosa TaxID=97972 RepID=A0A2V1DIG1_9PLEO|nr:hypothetical protein DM02DRAFT_63570 [Periconia macrospinosa]